MQHAGVRPGGHDAVVAGRVALQPGPQAEDALQVALAARVAERLGERAYDVLEAARGRVHGRLQLADLPLVLDQPQLRQERLQLRVTLAPGDGGVHGGVHTPQHPGGAAELKVADVGALDLVERRRLGQVGARSGPELAVAAVAVELLALLARGARPDVQHRLAGRLDHQHVVRLARPGQVRVRAVRPEPEVAVVAAHLQRARGDHQPLTREPLRQRGPPLGRPRGDRPRGVLPRFLWGPAGAHERGQFVGDGQIVASDVERLGHGAFLEWYVG